MVVIPKLKIQSKFKILLLKLYCFRKAMRVCDAETHRSVEARLNNLNVFSARSSQSIRLDWLKTLIFLVCLVELSSFTLHVSV